MDEHPDETGKHIESRLGHPDETGKHIESRLGHHYRRRKPCGYDKKAVMKKVGAWRAAANSKRKTKAKKLLID